VNHIDQIVAKIVDGEIDVESLSDHQKTLVIFRLYEIAESFLDTDLDKLGSEMLDSLEDVIELAIDAESWDEHPDLEESIQSAEDSGSCYLPPDDYVLQ